jgi:trehalose-6-phosphate synthase
MKITVRLILSLVAMITLVITIFTALQYQREKIRLTEELDMRAATLATSFEESISPLLIKKDKSSLSRIVEKFGNRTRLLGIELYSNDGRSIARTKNLNAWIADPPLSIDQILALEKNKTLLKNLPKNRILHVFYSPFQGSDGQPYVMGVFHNGSHIQEHLKTIWKGGFLSLLFQSLLISLATILVIRWNILAPLYRAADLIKGLRLGHHDVPKLSLSNEIFGPLAKEVTHMAASLVSARQAVEEEAKLRQSQGSVWTAERLKEHIRTTLENKPLFVVSNREPYMHVKKGKGIECLVPAGGLVTALEPILRVSGGTWIAHGSGDADSMTVDENNRIRVPPDDPQYSLRRVWLSKDEEDGYYYGFSNEGMWPLCHIAHTRPYFLPEDWQDYLAVNQKFADVVLEEIKGTEDPLILVQDYHFALLPRLIKESRPDAKVALFWHIPWPNPESFGICPWTKEVLHGMLGADLLGFHIQFHCNNFLDSVDRYLESRIDWERFNVNRQGHTTWVKPFPISIEFTSGSHGQHKAGPFVGKESLLKELGIKAQFLGVGVDRIDYTKGIIERFQGIERFLEKNKEYIGKFTFVELGAPSRTLIKRYHDLIGEIEAEVERINWRFKTKDWKPLIFLKDHHEHKEIEPYYRAADVCLVTSLHDGMNLVAKEFIASRADELGVLILSRFAGASRELRDALLVNPYDVDRMADMIRFSLEMTPDEQRIRMKRMRETVMENNIYRWAANLTTELAQIRLPAKSPTTIIL